MAQSRRKAIDVSSDLAREAEPVLFKRQNLIIFMNFERMGVKPSATPAPLQQDLFLSLIHILANSLRPLRYWMQVGESMPLHATSGGKAILASMQQSERDKIVSRMRLAKVTANTITSHTALREELVATAETGIAYSREEFEEGVIGISVAILKRDNQPEGSLSVVFPTVRDKPAHRKAIIDALRTGKARLEAEIGRPGAAPARSRSGKSRT